MASKMERTTTPGVFKRGGTYVFSYRSRGRQRWGSARTLDEARRMKRQAQADVDRGEHRDRSRVAFAEYATAWIENYRGRTARGFREQTRAGYRMTIDTQLIPYFEVERGLRLAEIEPRDVKAFITWLEKREKPTRPVKPGKPRPPRQLLSRSTIAGHLAVLRAMLADATEEGAIRSNPAAGVRLSVPEGDGTDRKACEERRAMTRVELGLILAEIPESKRLLYELLTHTGLRIGEAIELRWGRDVVFGDAPYLRVRWQFAAGRVCEPKAKYGKRDIPLSKGLARKLWQARAEQHGRDDELVFRTSRGTRLNRHNIYRDVLGPARKRAALEWVSLKTFRHTCASLLFAAPEQGGGGKNVKQAQEWLGHHSPAFTLEVYVHLMDDGLGEAGFLDAVVVPAGRPAEATIDEPAATAAGA